MILDSLSEELSSLKGRKLLKESPFVRRLSYLLNPGPLFNTIMKLASYRVTD